LLAAAFQSSAATEINFEAEAPQFEAAAEEYRLIWQQDGERIAATLHRLTGLRLEPGPIQTMVFEGVSNSGYRDIPMRMRASLPANTKRATLVHELSHRLISHLVPKDLEEHPVIFLFVYDTWVQLWGQEFADAQVAVECRRRGPFDYAGAWNDALALGKAGRAEAWAKFRATYQG
jgi:hypothetical protein